MFHQRWPYLYPFLVLTVALTAVSMTLSAGPARAFEIRGRVVNGTTGEPVGGLKVSVVDPRHGMAAEGQIETDAKGAFVASSLDDKISVFLVQASYEGVTYTEMIRPAGPSANVEVKVYDTTAAWDSVHVSLPQFMVRRSADTLSVERVFFITNHSNPPRTIRGPGAGFRVSIPENRLQITSLYATVLWIPIALPPNPTEMPGVYTVDYPFRPGETRVGASFDVAFGDSGYTYRETLPYDLDDVTVMTEDKALSITSPTLRLGSPEELADLVAYNLGSLRKGSTLELHFEGGQAQPPTEAEAQAQTPASGHQIVTLRDLSRNASIAVIAGFALLLVLVMGIAAKSPETETDQAALLASRRNSMLNQIAKLDDLFEMGTVSDQLYRMKRSELVETLARIMYRIERVQPKKQKTGRQPKGTPHAR